MQREIQKAPEDEIWDEEEEEWTTLDEELGIEETEPDTEAHLTDLDGWEGDLEESVRGRRKLLEEEFDVENPEKSVFSLEEVDESRVDRARNYMADFMEPEEGTPGTVLLNLSTLAGGAGLSNEAHSMAIDLAGQAPDSLFSVAAVLPSAAAGFGAGIVANIKFNNAREKASEKVRPTPMGGLPVIGEGVDDTVSELMEDSRVVEVENLNGLSYEMEDTVEGSWFHSYLTSRYEEPRLNHLSWSYDIEEEQLEWTLDYIIDWNDECPVEMDEEFLGDWMGSIDAYRFRGKIDAREPGQIEDLFSSYNPEQGREKVEEVYGSRVRELLEEFNYFEKDVTMQEVDRTTQGGREGAPGTITHIHRYPVNSEE